MITKVLRGGHPASEILAWAVYVGVRSKDETVHNRNPRGVFFARVVVDVVAQLRALRNSDLRCHRISGTAGASASENRSPISDW